MLGAVIGITKPSAVTWLNSELFTYALGFLMLSMGLTLTVDDFKKVPPTPHQQILVQAVGLVTQDSGKPLLERNISTTGLESPGGCVSESRV